MANYLAQFQAIKNTSDRLVVAVEDVSDLWPSIKEGLEKRLPLKKASLNNKTRNPVYVENLQAEFILTTDSRLRSRFPQEQYLFWFREPYATIVLVSCEDLDEFKTILKPRLKLIVQNEEREWFIVFVSKAHPNNDQATKNAKKVYARLEVDFNTRKRERCCKLDLNGVDASFWEDFDFKIVESIRNTLDRRVQFYEEEIRKMSEQRLMPVWNFCNFFILKESLAFMFEMAHLHEDSLREYDELELCYIETVSTPGKQRDFGGLEHGDDQAALLKPGFKPLSQIVQDDSFREFEFRQYLFARQAKLLFKLGRPLEVVMRGYSFIISFSKTLALHDNTLPFCLREVWVISACLAIISSTSSICDDGFAAADNEKEFYRLHGDLYSLCRIKFMRLAYLIGYGVEIEKSPVNSASLSMLPWPKPSIWPAVPEDASAKVLAKEKYHAVLATQGVNGDVEVEGGDEEEKEDDEVATYLEELFNQLKEVVQDFSPSKVDHELKTCGDLAAPNPYRFRSLGETKSFTRVDRHNTMILQANPRMKHFNIQRKQLPLEPSSLLREANRRRASLSVGNLSELIDYRQIDGSGIDGHQNFSPSTIQANTMSRTYSGPNLESSLSLDRPMRISEVHVAAEHALENMVTDPDLLKSLSSLEEFEQKYMELTKGAADNYHQSWWKRHGVALDGEIAALCFKHGNYDLAAKSYEKVCALYAGEGWQDLLAEVLPNLAECQKILNDQAGYLSSCVRLLSLEDGLFLAKERQDFQLEVVRLAHSEMKHPVPLDVSSLITFSGNPGPPLQLCDGDPGTLSVTVWSGFPDDITLESLSLTLTNTLNTDEGVKTIKSSDAHILKPGRNVIKLDVPPQKPGSYVLGVLTGQIGNLRFRSHNFSKGGPQDNDDFMSYEKPTRPVLKVLKPRTLVDISAAVSSALLMNELQWLGLIVKPINYSLKGALLSIDTGPGLMIDESQTIDINEYANTMEDKVQSHDSNTITENNTHPLEPKQLYIENGKIALPDWASDTNTTLWFPVHAIDDRMARAASADSRHRQNMVDGMRTIALKLEFGAFQNQIFERTIAVHFTDPFYVTTRVANKCNDGTLLLQVTIHSQVKATLCLYDAWLDLQAGFVHVRKENGRPVSSFFPLVISPSSTAGILFSICIDNMAIGDQNELLQAESILNVMYGISGDRSNGAHSPTSLKLGSSDKLFFKVAIALQRPILDPCVAIGFVPFSSNCLRVGQLINMKWRVERLKDLEASPSSSCKDEVLYEVDANPEIWMIAGRTMGHALLSNARGSRTEIAVTCMPLVSGHVRPPQLGLPGMDDANISCNPSGPHLVCVLPPTLSSSYCIPA